MPTLIANGDREPIERNERKIERVETELKYRLTNPAALAELIAGTEPLEIHQLYLSQPDEPYSLRLRETTDTNGASTYEVCLKSRGNITPQGLSRLESSVKVDEATFRYYEGITPVQLRKKRYEPVHGVTVDIIEGIDTPQAEIEDILINQDAFELYSAFSDVLQDVTDSPDGDNETLAHQVSGLEPAHEGQRDSEEIYQEIMAHASFHPKGTPLVVTIHGRSGSGKSTTASLLQRRIADAHPELSVASLSTDDYHRGKKHLEQTYGRPCTNWDEHSVYNMNLLAFDLWELSQGNPVESRRFDFRTQEVETEGRIMPSDIIIVEGIVAQSPDLDKARHLHFDVGTPLATCLGRDMDRIRKDTRGNGGIGDQLDRFAYIMKIGEPTYREQQRTIRNGFSASVRPLAHVAIQG